LIEAPGLLAFLVQRNRNNQRRLIQRLSRLGGNQHVDQLAADIWLAFQRKNRCS
jgi:hypothetical protein